MSSSGLGFLPNLPAKQEQSFSDRGFFHPMKDFFVTAEKLRL
jgi:hypothetical protein